MVPMIDVCALSKRYRLGEIGAGSLREAVSGWWRRRRGYVAHESGREFWALRDVSFTLAPGEVLGVIGRNGAGKSTLLKLLSRVTEPTSGEAFLRGRVASLLEVGTGFHPELTGRENIFLSGAIMGMKVGEIRSRFDEIVAFAGLERFVDTPVKRYSSGMYVRLGFAVAAHLEAEILIVDEVLAVGDKDFRDKCAAKMRSVADGEGRTILFVSHNMGAIRALCGTALLLESGAVSYHGSVEEAIQKYMRRRQDVSYVVDAGQRARSTGMGSIARIERVETGNPPMRSGEPFEIRAMVRCDIALRGLVASFGFDSMEGSRVLTVDSDVGSDLIDVGPGRWLLKIVCEFNPLHPGAYTVGASLWGAAGMLDWIPGLAEWEVAPSVSDNYSHRGYGGCRVPVRVQCVRA